MSLKSCFWPLIGDKIFGLLGDVVDILSIFTTLFGVCTAFGLGARQINQGLLVPSKDEYVWAGNSEAHF